MSGGGGSKQSYVPQQQQPQPVYRPVEAPEIPTTGYGGMGYYSVPNPFVQGSKPSWMQGYFDMPSWGLDAVTGQPLTQEQLQVQQPQPQPQVAEQAPAPAPEPAPQQQQAPVDMRSMYDVFSRQRDWEQRRDDMRMQDGLGGSNGAMMGMFNPAFSPMSKYERGQNRMQAAGGNLFPAEDRPGLLALLRAQGVIS
jgi:hypothetical protein